MRAIPDRHTEPSAPLAAELLAILAAAGGDAVGGMVVVDGRDGPLRVAYANDSFRAQTGADGTQIDGVELGDAGALGPALQDLAASCAFDAPLRRRVAYRQGGALLAVEITATRHVFGGEGRGSADCPRDGGGRERAGRRR